MSVPPWTPSCGTSAPGETRRCGPIRSSSTACPWTGSRWTREEIDAAWDGLDGDFRETLRLSADNIRRFHETQVRRDTVLTDRPGVVLGQRYTPIEKVGICVPGSPAAFPSTILMNVIPAKIAGVREIVVVTPPDRDGAVSPEALAAAKIAGADRVFKIGGAQAVAALAYGTETVAGGGQDRGPRRHLRGHRQAEGVRPGGHRHDRRPQ